MFLKTGFFCFVFHREKGVSAPFFLFKYLDINKCLLSLTKQNKETMTINGKTYKKVHHPAEHISFGNMMPYTSDAVTYYESEVMTYTYRGVKVMATEHLNLDGSLRGYEIKDLSIGLGKPLHSDDVRSHIDAFHNEFNSTRMNNPKEVSYRQTDDLLDDAINNLINRKYTILEKRFIINDLIKRGLKVSDAIDFYKEIW